MRRLLAALGIGMVAAATAVTMVFRDQRARGRRVGTRLTDGRPAAFDR